MENDAQLSVLVVDDVPDNIMVLDEVLRAKYNVIAAINGEKALKIISSATPPDLVLLDVMMPGMDGFEVCRRIKGNDQTAFIPVVMVTALSGQEDRIKALDAGADDFLNKPIDPTEVLARVKSLLRIKKLHDDLKRSFTELQCLEQLRENLTYMIIHDLRTPLTGIIGGLSMLYDFASVKGNPDAEEMYEMASQNSHKLLVMINDLLDITKMESGELHVERIAVDADEVAAEVENTVRAVAQVENVNFTSEIAPEIPKLPADREMLCRVLVNLVANALKFTPAGGDVHLLIEKDTDEFVRLAVIDNGPGIPAGYEEKIFEKFGQVESGERKKLSTGLGLTFCKMAVEAHGGKIWVESTSGQGSKFCIQWPLD
jgi:signal transduction histidine kinase